VIIGLFVGAVLLIVVENRFRRKAKTHNVEDITPIQALKVGLFQCLAMWPGMSRSSSTIMGGWISGLSSSVAAEFSFFLAIPIMLGASLLKLVKFQMEFGLGSLDSTELVSFGLGFVVAFIVALVCVKGFVGFVKKRPMRIFAVYRIALSVILVLLAAFKVVSF
jgi:undecaprenyl-diphosphatase